jgi:hypothetical protein
VLLQFEAKELVGVGLDGGWFADAVAFAGGGLGGRLGPFGAH